MAKPARRVLWRRLSYLVVFAVLATAGWWLLRWSSRGPEPPSPNLEGTAPELVAAITDVREAVRSAPRSAEQWGRLGGVLLGNNFFEEAAEAYQRANMLDPGDGRWAYLHAVATEFVDLPRAIELYAGAIPLTDDAPYRYVRYGLALERAGKLDQARAAWERAAEQAPNSVDARLGLGRLALGRQDLDEAREHFTIAAQTDPRCREAHVALIQICVRRKDSAGAALHRRLLANARAEALPPHDPLLKEVRRQSVTLRFVDLLQQADRLEARGDLPGFVAICRQLIQLQPNNPNPRVRMGVALARMGRFAESITAFEEAQKRNPQDANAYYNHGVVLGQMGKWAEAAVCYRTAIDRKPDHADAHFNLGICLYQLGRAEDAAAAFRQAVAARPDHYFAHHNLGEAAIKLGRLAEAEKHLEIAVQLRPLEARSRESLEKARELKQGESASGSKDK